MGIEVGARGVVESEIVLSLVQPDKGWEVAEVIARKLEDCHRKGKTIKLLL